MSERLVIKKFLNKNGEERVYNYKYSKDEYNQYIKNYQVNAGLTQRVACGHCGRIVQKRNLNKHQDKKICKNYTHI